MSAHARHKPETPRAKDGRAPDVFTPGGYTPMRCFSDDEEGVFDHKSDIDEDPFETYEDLFASSGRHIDTPLPTQHTTSTIFPGLSLKPPPSGS